MGSKSVSVLLGLIAVILLAVTAYLYNDLQNVKNEIEILKEDLSIARTDQQVATPTVPNEEEPVVPNNNLLYTNAAYGFTLTLPERWRDYRVIESKENNGNIFRFELKQVTGKFQSPFLIAVFTRAQWASINSGALKPYTRIDEKNDLIFAYATAQDDTGYDGFPNPQPGQTYYGPLSDVTNIIIPSFSWK